MRGRDSGALPCLGVRAPRAPAIPAFSWRWSSQTAYPIILGTRSSPAPGACAAGPAAGSPAVATRVTARVRDAYDQRADRRPRRASRGARSALARRRAPLHAVGRPPLLDLRRLQGGGHRDRRRPPRAGRRLGRRGLRQGDPEAGSRGAHGGPGRHQRHERDRRRALQPLAGHGARRPRARDALGLRLAPGDRPRAVRRAAGQVGRDRQGHRPDRRA